MKKLQASLLCVVVLCISAAVLSAQTKKKPAQPKPLITLHRGVCYGTCPNYELRIYADGRVEYEGHLFVGKTGKASSRISKASVRKLRNEFRRIGFMKLKDRYEKIVNPDGTVLEVTDLPTTTTSFRCNGKTKTVMNYYGGPPELRTLERMIDELTNSRQWVHRKTED